MRSGLVSALAVAGLCAACGAPEPTPDPRSAWPESRYLLAEGHGPTRRAAEDDARARIAARIEARITARLTVSTTETPTGAEERVEQQIITESRFDRAELIELPGALQRCAPTGCVVTAVLDRQTASARLRDAAAEPSSRLRVAAERSGEGDLRAFTQSLRAAERAWRTVASLGWQRTAILGAIPTDFAADRARHRSLQAQRAERLGQVRIALVAIEGEPEVDRRLRGALSGALSALDVPHQASDARTAGALRLVGRASIGCHRGPVGPRCALDAQLELLGPDGRWAGIELGDAGLAAIDPREPARARAALLDRIEAARLGPAVQAALAPVLPIAAPLTADGRR